MPIYNFYCESGCSDRKVMAPEQAKSYTDTKCSKHGCLWRRGAVPPSTTAIETIDNGLMVKRVETYVGIKDMVSERARLDDPRLQREYVLPESGSAEEH